MAVRLQDCGSAARCCRAFSALQGSFMIIGSIQTRFLSWLKLNPGSNPYGRTRCAAKRRTTLLMKRQRVLRHGAPMRNIPCTQSHVRVYTDIVLRRTVLSSILSNPATASADHLRYPPKFKYFRHRSAVPFRSFGV